MRQVTAILAGGFATRLGVRAAAVPKSMVEVGGQPFIAHQLRRLAAQGFREVVVCAGHLGEQIERFVENGAAFGCNVRYSFDGAVPLGTGGALLQALPMLGPGFLVMYGDSYLTQPWQPVWQAFLQSQKAALMTVFHNEDLWELSNVECSEGKIVRYEKTAPRETGSSNPRPARMRHIDYGAGCIRAEALAAWAPEGPFDLARFYRAMLEQDDLAAFEVQDRFYEIGSPAGLAETRALLGRDRAAE